MNEPAKDPVPHKSSAEILSELFSAFNAKPPKLERDSDEKSHKKHKKSKKKHKHKEKKHKKKSKHKRSSPESLSSDSDSDSSYHKHKSKKKFGDLDLDTIIKTTLNFKKREKLDDIIENIKIKQEQTDKIDIKEEKDDITNGLMPDKYSKRDAQIKTDDPQKEFEKISNKIVIKDLKNSLVYENTVKETEEKAKQSTSRIEDGEITDSDSDNKSDDIPNDQILDEPLPEIPKKEKEKSDRKRSHDSRSRHDDSKRSRKEKSDRRDKHHYRYRSSSRDRDRHCYRSGRDDYYHTKSSYHRNYSNDHDRYKYKHEKRRSKSRERSRSKGRSRSRDRWEKRHRSKSPHSSAIDKKKLLEIARRNAISMLKSGTLPDALTLGPQAQEKVIAAIKAGGKTIEELTDFCKNLSKKEALGELSSVSSVEDEAESESEEGVEKVFHHPFQIKDKPTAIIMNIKNATPLPIKTSKEKSAELRMQFPVSSGQLHRKTESEWVPVPAKPEPVPAPVPPPAPIKAVPQPVPKPTITIPLSLPGPAMVPAPLQSINVPQTTEVDISSIVSQRLSAMRKLQENPHDIQAITQMQRAQKDMENWAQSKQQPGQFTGTTGAHILSAAELSSGYQAWARKDQLKTAAPVVGGMGMHLLQKMGWKPGEGLGKEKSGQLEPLLLEVKLDKKGLVTGGEMKNKKGIKTTGTTKTLSGKHPVSLLGEYASKKKLGIPQYEVCFECGPDHQKNFLFKVILNGVEYKSNVVSSKKKQAKAEAALVCLQQMGVLP